MKKTIAFIVVSILLISCSQDVKFSDPGLQANKNNKTWKGLSISATQTSTGVVTINASAEDGEIVLKCASSSVGSYVFGTADVNTKAFHSTLLNETTSYTYTTTPISGPAAMISSINAAGTNYVDANAVATTTNGLGTGLKVNVKTIQGGVNEVKILAPGTNYTTGDIVTIAGGNNFANFTVLNVEGSNGEIIITNSKDGRISGTFKFNAKGETLNPNINQFVSFQNGNFYNIPLTKI